MSRRCVAVAAGLALIAVPAGASAGTAVPTPNPGGIGSPAVIGNVLGPPYTQDVYETGPDHRVVRWHVSTGTVLSRIDLGGYSVTGVAAAFLGQAGAGSASPQMVLVRGRDDAVWFRERRTDGTWTGWRSLGGRITARPGVLLTADEAGQIVVVVARGTDGAMWERARDPRAGWTPGWRRVGGQLVGGPAAANDSKAYVRGTDGRVWFASRSGPVAAGWSAWRPLPALPGGRRIGSEAGADSRDDVAYVADAGGAGWLWRAGWTGTGGRFLGAPASVTQVVGNRIVVSIFGRGTNGLLYQRTATGWIPLGRS